LLQYAGFLAPLLEESLFRGFLLTSLTKIMPNWAAVLASSTAFGIAHLSIKDLPVLIVLGCWLGAIYCRSRNLLTPMIVHGAWNSTVLSLLFWLTANGVDIQQLLKENAF
jgi:membrane protease YdiL (CAAX protease family)